MVKFQWRRDVWDSILPRFRPGSGIRKHVGSCFDRCCSICCCCPKLRILWRSLTYNECADLHYNVDVLLTPAFYFVDNYVKYFGPLFVAFLISMVGLVIAMTYLIVIPYEIVRKSTLESAIWLVVGNWLLINFSFNYYMAFQTDPGAPPRRNTGDDKTITSDSEPSAAVDDTPVAGMCRKCVAPKPPRTHHCSVCGRCVLKMDHHCPWLSQCVGHLNHRYFFLTMFYMAVGAFFLCIGMFPMFSEHFWGEGEYAPWCTALSSRLSYSWLLCDDTLYQPLPPESALNPHVAPNFPLHDNIGDSNLLTSTVFTGAVESDDDDKDIYAPKFDIGMNAHNCLMFIFFAAMAIVAGVGALCSWHAYLVSRGETTVEQFVNKTNRDKWKKLGRVYLNPYDFGIWENWRIFLGIDQPHMSLWRHILLPSWHPPSGDGLSWRTNPYSDPNAQDASVQGYMVPTAVTVVKQI